MTAADKIAKARALIGFAYRMSDAALRLGMEGTTEWDQIIGCANVYAAQDALSELADIADAQAKEIAKLKAIIAKMDAHSPRADRTCDEPGITLSEAVLRKWPHLRALGDAQ